MRLGLVVLAVAGAAAVGVTLGLMGGRLRSMPDCPTFTRITTPPGYVRVATISKVYLQKDFVVIDNVGGMPLASWLQIVGACGGELNLFDIFDDAAHQGPRQSP
jgi:hypothetical protein